MQSPYSRAEPVIQHWQVRVLGDRNDLWFLARELAYELTRIAPDEFEPGQYVIVSNQFASSIQPEIIAVLGQEIAERLTGLLRCTDGSMTPLITGATYRVRMDGEREVFAPTKLVAHKFRPNNATPVITKSIGSVIGARPTAVQLLSRLIESDSTVARTMHYCGGSDAQCWTGLADIREAIENDVGGLNRLQKNGWASNDELERFQMSASRFGIRETRALREWEQPRLLSNAMTLSEAKQHMERLLREWLGSKGVSI